MTRKRPYVDLNPIRAGIACNLMGSRNTSIRQRCKDVRGNPESAAKLVRPLWGFAACTMLPITVGDYIELVDATGRQDRKDMPGAISGAEPRALKKLGICVDHWTRTVKGVGFGFWRAVGTVDAIEEKTAAIKQQVLRGIGLARSWFSADQPGKPIFGAAAPGRVGRGFSGFRMAGGLVLFGRQSAARW